MRQVVLGKSGLTVSELGFGCIPIIRLTKSDAVSLLQYALDCGITLYDSAHVYGDSEEKLGVAFKQRRSEAILATKTPRRDFDGAREHFETSLKRFGTDQIDLFQLHGVSKEEEWEQITAPRGALEFLYKAKQEGSVRSIGVTSHALATAIKLVKLDVFDTVQFPHNIIEVEAQEELFPAARERGLGILVMKPFGGGAIEDGRLAFKFLRASKGTVPIPGFDDKWQVDQAISVYEQDNVVNEEDLLAMENLRGELGRDFCRRCQYCEPCPNGVQIYPAMQYEISLRRMSPEHAAHTFGRALETAANCTECRECVERCPYSLPIPEKLKRNLDLYRRHQA